MFDTSLLREWHAGRRRQYQSSLCLWNEYLIVTVGMWVLCGLGTQAGDIPYCTGLGLLLPERETAHSGLLLKV